MSVATKRGAAVRAFADAFTDRAPWISTAERLLRAEQSQHADTRDGALMVCWTVWGLSARLVYGRRLTPAERVRMYEFEAAAFRERRPASAFPVSVEKAAARAVERSPDGLTTSNTYTGGVTHGYSER